MTKNTTIIIIVALVCTALAAGAFFVLSGSGSHPRPEDATIDELVSIQKNPPDDYVTELTQIIRKNKNRNVRDVAVSTLTDIALRKGEPDKITGFLKDLTVNEKDPVIMSAAYAGIDLIRDEYPLPPMGSLNLSVSGNVKTGGEVFITATFSSTSGIDEAVIGLDFPQGSVETINTPVYYTNLTANTPATHTFHLRLLRSGQFKIPVQLMVSTDRTDYEQTERAVILVVRENNGEYIIV